MADIVIGSDTLLTKVLSKNDRITLTKAETNQQIATMEIGDFLQHIENSIPFIGENRCLVNDFTLKTNSGNNQLPPDGFAKYTPLFEVGKTYVASGYRDGEKAGQIMLHGKSGFKIINFYTPFTITEEVDTLYFRSVNPSSFVMYNKVKIEEGTKVTPFIPGDIAGNIDYSLLMEHPTGEWFLDMDGMRKPVYTQTFMGTVGGGQILLGANICQLLSFFGYIETIGGSGEENMPPHFGGNYDWKYYKTKDKISIEIASSSSQIIGKRYLFVAKYVKY